MRKINTLVLMIFFIFSQATFAGSFGPRESRLIMEEGQSSSYRIDNSDPATAWLVQAWVEDVTEKRTHQFEAVPVTFRVEPSSVFTVRLLQTGKLPDDRESLFWVVSNSIPGGSAKKDAKEEDKVSAKLSMAYRFKVPMIYRPASLKGTKSTPGALKWTTDANGKIKVYNPTRYVVQLHSIQVNGQIYQGNGISYIIQPMGSVTLKANAKINDRIHFGVVNDFGAVKEFTGTVNS
ncbi:molecular chaperone [Escherichia coli]|uniref:fimbrial biogenesis chaperone n=1 Tax=Escherichia coli TaxID=562 RepID=UPI0018269E95|nr:molecular chaperone [Escherichia coli]EFH6680914.1 fimbria/pilus periplasmic chaperone [Escherichia coli]EJS1738427.1 molecular chaperone [Escherichia albertii]MCZ8792866.1 molecular chaperone [Escherichia albertii]